MDNSDIFHIWKVSRAETNVFWLTGFLELDHVK